MTTPVVLIHGLGIHSVPCAHPENVAGIGTDGPPIVVGHSFGGLIAQKLLDQGLVAGAVCISPAPIKGIRALPSTVLRSSFPVLRSQQQAAGRRTDGVTVLVLIRHCDPRGRVRGALSRPHDSVAWSPPLRCLHRERQRQFAHRGGHEAERSRSVVADLCRQGPHRPGRLRSRCAHALRKGGRPVQLHSYEDRGHSAPFDHGWREPADDALGWLEAQGLKP